VVPAEHHGKEAVLRGTRDELGDALADDLDLSQVSDALVADRRRLGDRPFDVPPVDAPAPEVLDPRGEIRIPDRRRPHVDATPTRAEVEAGADHRDRASVGLRRQGGQG
jgi:hypothetical protein